ncbi:hypothetical protein R6L23_17165 [Streptomyces sp. SR27]|uniref:hypothetical protein n=1 Tax=Streptomyces sp. SR27 TaxID=3076630 RepID=UPI00295AE6B6|nr:hypothetical protein [Streptomyces sp. SR27]MDV9189920.1 hypothetical protein [Streptomyces sp. SR27]
MSDDGVGMPPSAARSGLRDLTERARCLGGDLSVRTRPRPPGGTVLEWRVPLPADRE